MRYRRSKTTGACYFFTVNLIRKNSHFLVDHVEELRDSIHNVKRNHPFRMDAIVIMPNHLHALLTLPQGDMNFSTRWNLIKGGFSRKLSRRESVSKSRNKKGERGIWQRRFWEHLIRDEHDFSSHVDYIHYNPVKHGYVDKPVDWPYSSIHHYISAGIIDADWAGGDKFEGVDFGE